MDYDLFTAHILGYLFRTQSESYKSLDLGS